MTNLEKVRKGLQAHESGCGHRSEHCDKMECPYRYVNDICDCNVIGLFRDANELIKDQDEHIHKLEDQLYTITQWRANAGAFD